MGPETYFSRTTEPSFRALGTHFPFELTRGISRKSRRSWKSRARRSAWREPHKNTRQKYLRNMTLYCNALEFIERIWFTSDEICLSADENAVSDMPVMKVSGLFFVGFHVVSASSVSQLGGLNVNFGWARAPSGLSLSVDPLVSQLLDSLKSQLRKRSRRDSRMNNQSGVLVTFHELFLEFKTSKFSGFEPLRKDILDFEFWRKSWPF